MMYVVEWMGSERLADKWMLVDESGDRAIEDKLYSSAAYAHE